MGISSIYYNSESIGILITNAIHQYDIERERFIMKKKNNLFVQKLMGLFLITAGIFACVMEPQEGGAALILFGIIGADLLFSKKRLIY